MPSLDEFAKAKLAELEQVHLRRSLVATERTDGIWAKYWYDRVEQSTGFEPYRSKSGDLPPLLAALERECRPLYERLYAHRLTG